MAKKINRKMVLDDIRAGVDENALMDKYGLTPGQLASVMRRLDEAGLLAGSQEGDLIDATERIEQVRLTCPACAASLPTGLDECPKCGVIFSKYKASDEPLKKQEGQTATSIPGLFTGEIVQVEQRSPFVWIGALLGVVIILAALYFMFRSSNETSQVSRSEPPVVRTVTTPEAEQARDAASEVAEVSEEREPEAGASPSAGVVASPDSGDAQARLEEAGEPTQTGPAELEPATSVPEPEKSPNKPDTETVRALDSFGDSIIQEFEGAVQQWNSDDFKNFAARASQKLEEASASGIPESIKQTAQNLIEQLQTESREGAAQAFRQLIGLIKPELQKASQESKAKFFASAQEVRRDIENSRRQ